MSTGWYGWSELSLGSSDNACVTLSKCREGVVTFRCVPFSKTVGLSLWVLTKEGVFKAVVLTPIKAIRKKRLECTGNRYKSVRLCEAKECPLYVYGMGKRPSRQDRDRT
ncbi:MAG: hypothetical protein A4E57_00013 [Syntrophorhabdaceae bacterium PtaU1.Bin034]|nr:MAG: hypothetical protein A4E57_00013 [Syntrophorhabdaceae bacterium PtaU1.Bin034]